MKTRAISLLVICSIILSLFTIYIFADEAVDDNSLSESGYTSLYIHYKNSYGDEIDDIGSDLSLNNAQNSAFQRMTDENGNTYGYYNFNDPSSNVYMQLSPAEEHNIGPDMLGYMIFEMDINDFGNPITTSKFLEINSGKGTFESGDRIAASDILNISNDENGNYFYFCGDKTQKIYFSSNTWVNIRCELSVLSASANEYTFRCYIEDGYFESSFPLGTPQIIYQIRFGSSKSTNQIFGLDNIELYTTPQNISNPTYGTLAMKVGAENAQLNGNQIELVTPPMLINGLIYCPVDIIEDFCGKSCPDEYIYTIESKEYIFIDDVELAFATHAAVYDMGLIMLGNSNKFLQEDASASEISDFMKGFVFNIPTPAEFKNDVAEYTNDFDHPYLLVNQNKFDELKALYDNTRPGSSTDEESLLYGYVSDYITAAEKHLKNYCGITPSGSYSGIRSDMIPVNKNYSQYSNNGYDNGGRLSVNTAPLLYFAFAYQITKELNYARAAYDFMLYIGKWNHWGPDHFLNCADTAAPFAIAYDWLYDAFVELEAKGEKSKCDGEVYDKSKLATILFTHVIIPGYVQSNNLTCPWPGTANSRYATKTSNWNAVCVSGVVAAALVLIEEDISTMGMTFNTQKKVGSRFIESVTPIEQIGAESIHEGLYTYSDYAAKLTSMNLGTLAKYGLNQYVPDGSYIESPSYWAYGTNTLFRLTASLLSSTGDDYGFMDAWGMDTTCYFAIHSESSDYKTWNFNDGGVSTQDSSFFFFVGNYYQDENLIKVRKKHLEDGKKYSIYDILFYNTSVVGAPDLATEYAMIGIDAFAVRSSWDRGSIYSGIIGGQNNCSHGQMDAGSFIYHNKGKIWFHDLGADQYNIKYTNPQGQNKGYFSNYELYRVGAEGHNVLMISSEQGTLPYGQLNTANPKIIDSRSGDNGGYAVIDMSDAYGSHVTDAKRGLLFTSSRSTVVIQDEYVFNGSKTAYWFGHYQIADGYVDNVFIAADGRTAFMISGEDIMRVSILSDNKDLRFEIMDAYTYVLDTTHRTDKNNMDTNTTETNRDNIKKLAIKCENVTELNLAVVIEEVGAYEFGCSYEYTNIADWQLSSSEKLIIDTKFKADFDYDTINTGSYILDAPNNSFILNEYQQGLHSYAGIISDTSYAADDGSLKLYFNENKPLYLSNYKYIAFDTDIFTESSFVENALLGINILGSDGDTTYAPILKLSDNQIIANNSVVTLQNSFKHVTLILDIHNALIYLYVDDEFVVEIQNVIDTGERIANFEFKLPYSSLKSSILIDNLSVRSFSNDYDSTQLSNLLSNNCSISEWSDRVAYDVISIPLATSNGTDLYTNAQIETAIANGKNVTLLRDTLGLINVTSAVSVFTNGYDFEYVSEEYFATENDTAITFSSGKVTVNWHIGNDIITEEYSGANIATFKGHSDKVGKISFNKNKYDFGVKYDLYTTGWSNVKGGAALAPDEMIVSDTNCNFWLVSNIPLDCLFVTIDSAGNITQFNEADKLRSVLEANNGSYDIVLCNDIELVSQPITTIAAQGKNLYLNGYTIKHTAYTNHAYIYRSNSSADFNIQGPGTLEYDGSLTLFTSQSATTDVTSKFGIVVNSATIKTNSQLVDLRVGQHKFIDCNIYQTDSTKTLIALWNKNSAFGSGGVPVNLMTFTFDNCVVECTGGVVSYSASSYSELYVIDTDITSKSYVLDASGSLKFSVSGNSSIIAEKLFSKTTFNYNSVVFGDGTATNLVIPSAYMNSSATLTNNYDSALPYRVSERYATVTWKTIDGEVILSEKVAVGTAPKIIAKEIIEYLNGVGEGYTYDLKEIETTADVVLTPILKSYVPILYSMNIENDLTMYLYIQKSEMNTKVKSVKVDGVRIMQNSYDLVEVNGGEYYKYSILTFTPAKATNDIEIIIEYLDGRTRVITTSAIDYLEELLAVSADENQKILIIKLLRYIQSAHAYFTASSEYEQNKIDKIIDAYKEYDVIFGNINNVKVSTAKMRDSLKSACFNLSASVRIRFYLNPEYTGNISVTLNDVVYNYSITNGSFNKNNYIEIIIPASLINEEILLSDGANSIKYGLGAYTADMNNTDLKLYQLLLCLSEYSSAAERFVAD